MSLFRELLEGFTSGVIEGAANHLAGLGSRVEEYGRVERLCAAIGWTVDERSGNMVALHFKDPLVGTRKVMVSDGDGPLVVLSAVSHAIHPARLVPEQVAGNLLIRNWNLDIGAWEATVDRDGDAIFRVTYSALGAGLDAHSFKYICERLANEALAFDRSMQAAGLLAAR
ncbi:MAG TPA: hypothetical protein VFA18_02430 [Gemmataceae bacterium]|nr:hypothetical protein [Gemmataceae bacterium]